jgi:hypothetical protein
MGILKLLSQSEKEIDQEEVIDQETLFEEMDLKIKNMRNTSIKK